MEVTEKDLMAIAKFADAIIAEQKNYIKELESQVDDLQKALDAVLLNKCRTRKVKVKIYGKGKQTQPSFNGKCEEGILPCRMGRWFQGRLSKRL